MFSYFPALFVHLGRRRGALRHTLPRCIRVDAPRPELLHKRVHLAVRAEDGLHVGTSNRGDHDLAPSGLDELEGPDERVPLVVGIDDELNPFLIEAGVALRERDARRGVGGFADADEKFHAFSLKVGACAPDFEDCLLYTSPSPRD